MQGAFDSRFDDLLATMFIFDTDSGFFADDGAALTMLMRSPLAREVRGVTVVSGGGGAGGKGAEGNPAGS